MQTGMQEMVSTNRERESTDTDGEYLNYLNLVKARTTQFVK